MLKSKQKKNCVTHKKNKNTFYCNTKRKKEKQICVTPDSNKSKKKYSTSGFYILRIFPTVIGIKENE